MQLTLQNASLYLYFTMIQKLNNGTLELFLKKEISITN